MAHVWYSERRGVAAWPEYLAELEVRFGKADFVGQNRDKRDVALWCSDATDCKLAYSSDKPRLSVMFLPQSETFVVAGDRLHFDLDEGRDRFEERRRFYAGLRDVNPSEAQRLYQQCRSPEGKFRTDDEADLHYLSLLPMGRRAGPILSNIDGVPTPVLTTLGFERGRSFGPGVCFNSSDVFIESPGCKSCTMVSFTWARQIDGLWLVSRQFGGVSLRREYVAVRKEQGGYRKVWWDSTLTDFNAWRTNGAVPMLEEHR